MRKSTNAKALCMDFAWRRVFLLLFIHMLSGVLYAKIMRLQHVYFAAVWYVVGIHCLFSRRSIHFLIHFPWLFFAPKGFEFCFISYIWTLFLPADGFIRLHFLFFFFLFFSSVPFRTGKSLTFIKPIVFNGFWLLLM